MVLDEKGPITPHERDAIMTAIDNAIEQSCEIFFQLRQKVQIDAREVAEKRADQLQIEDNLREEFIQALSHDLNHPLNNVKLCVEIMQKNNATVYDLKRLLKIIADSVAKAESFLSDLLEVKGLSSGLPIRKQRVNIADVIWNEVQRYNLTTRRTIRLKLSDKELLVSVDAKVMIRAFDNLLDNAMKHGDPSAEITVGCRIEAERLILQVHNYGPVIPAEHIQSVFHKYYTSSEDARKGWGIGLSMVRAVAAAHGGEVTVKSDETAGTEFSLIVPVH